MSTPTPQRPYEPAMVGRSYTRARRRPGVIGQWPGGGAIPLGPYTVPQVLVTAASATVLMLVMWRWAPFGALPDAAVVCTVPLALGYAVRSVHVDGRNPLWVLLDAVALLAAPRRGRMGGRPVTTARAPRYVTGVCTFTRRRDVPPAPEAGPRPAAVRTDGDVQALLAQRRSPVAGTGDRSRGRA